MEIAIYCKYFKEWISPTLAKTWSLNLCYKQDFQLVLSSKNLRWTRTYILYNHGYQRNHISAINKAMTSRTHRKNLYKTTRIFKNPSNFCILPSITELLPCQIIQNLCSCQTSSTNFISKNIDLYILHRQTVLLFLGWFLWSMREEMNIVKFSLHTSPQSIPPRKLFQ